MEDQKQYALVETAVIDKSDGASLKSEKKGILLEWSNIHYTVIKKDPKSKNVEQKILLHSMSGKALPGEMLGIMGTSGAGR